MRQVHPDLMGTAGFQFDAQVAYLTIYRQTFDVGHGMFAMPVNHGETFAVLGMTTDIRFDTSHFLGILPVNESFVDTLDRMLGKLLGQPVLRRIIFGGHDETGRVLIEPMDDSGTYDSPYTGEIGTVRQKRIHHSPIGISSRRMYHHPRRFVNHDQIVIFIGDTERNFLSDSFEGFENRFLPLNHLPGRQLHPGFDRDNTINHNQSLVDVATNLAPCHTSHRREEGIKTEGGATTLKGKHTDSVVGLCDRHK